MKFNLIHRETKEPFAPVKINFFVDRHQIRLAIYDLVTNDEIGTSITKKKIEERVKSLLWQRGADAFDGDTSWLINERFISDSGRTIEHFEEIVSNLIYAYWEI